MSGLPDLNYPAFHAKAAELRAAGHHVENPAENPAPPCGSWQGYMRLAIAQLVTCDAIHLLPGWQASRGAVVEMQLANILGLTIASRPSMDDEAQRIAWRMLLEPLPTGVSGVFDEY